MNLAVKFKRVPGINLPEYKTSGAAGADVKAFIKEDIIIKPGDVECVPTGLFLEIPNGYEIQLRPRSGLAIKEGIALINCVGTIDADFRNEVCVPIVNHSNKVVCIEDGERICQGILNKVEQIEWDEVNSVKELGTTDRKGGFGHTGKS